MIIVLLMESEILKMKLMKSLNAHAIEYFITEYACVARSAVA